MVLREFGITKDFIRNMELNVFKAPVCECGCDNTVIVLETGNEKDFVGTFLDESNTPKALAIVKKHKKVFLHFRSDLLGDPYTGIVVCSINKNANIAREIRDFIKTNEIRHVGVFNYTTHRNDKVLEIVK